MFYHVTSRYRSLSVPRISKMRLPKTTLRQREKRERSAFRINYVANEPRVKLRHGVIVGRMRDAFATFNEHA